MRKDVRPFFRDSVNQELKSCFSEEDMQFLSVSGANRGWGTVLASASNVYYKLCARKMLMIDRILSIDATGGAYGLGLLIGEKDLAREHWYATLECLSCAYTKWFKVSTYQSVKKQLCCVTL